MYDNGVAGIHITDSTNFFFEATTGRGRPEGEGLVGSIDGQQPIEIIVESSSLITFQDMKVISTNGKNISFSYLLKKGCEHLCRDGSGCVFAILPDDVAGNLYNNCCLLIVAMSSTTKQGGIKGLFGVTLCTSRGRYSRPTVLAKLSAPHVEVHVCLCALQL